jgi:threonine/homoserine/homoserine lactone efflux protein
MDLSSLLIFAGALIVSAGSPGPSIATLVARVLSRGHRDIWPFLAALWIGEAIWLTLAVCGLAAIAQTFHLVFVALKWIGVGYLLFLAWKMWNAASAPAGGSIPDTSAGRMFAAGFAVTLGNPKIMVFYMALLPAIIDLQHPTLLGWAELTATMVLVLVAIDLSWVALAARSRNLLQSPRAMRVANRCSAGLMASAATAIATR